MQKILAFCFNPFGTNCYAVASDGRDDCVVIDPCFSDDGEKARFMGALESAGLRPAAVLLTHGHFDHIYGVKAMQDLFPGLPCLMSAADRPLVEMAARMSGAFGLPEPDCGFGWEALPECVAAGESGAGATGLPACPAVELAGMSFDVIATPGHSPGSVSYLLHSPEGDALFSGDTLFAGAIGRSDLPFGEYDDEIRSIMEKLIILDPATRLLPGHGPESTIGAERTGNPFLEPFNEPEEPLDPDAQPVIIRN